MKKLILGIVSLSTLVAFIVWLWTLQPQPDKILPATDENQKQLSDQSQKNSFDPRGGSVLKTAKVKLSGKTEKGNFVAIYTDSFALVTKAAANSSFAQDIELQKGLNLVKVTSISPDLTKIDETILTYYFDAGTTATTVYAGSVKTIFDTLITLTTTNGDKAIRAGKSTDIVVPKEEDAESTPQAPLKQIRIGDYAVALASPQEDDTPSPLVDKITILRSNKPTIDTTVALAQTLTTVKANALTVKSKDKSIDLTINKNTEILLDGKTAKAADIQKDKNAIVVYRAEEDDNLVDLIYIL